MKLDVKQASLSLGALFGIMHAAGVLLITLTGGGWVDFTMTMHHTRMAYSYLPLDIINLMTGTIVAAFVGLVVGMLFATIWNQLDSM